jgi:hypothetical protein
MFSGIRQLSGKAHPKTEARVAVREYLECEIQHMTGARIFPVLCQGRGKCCGDRSKRSADRLFRSAAFICLHGIITSAMRRKASNAQMPKPCASY